MKCPFCAEEILPDAKKCKHCGEWLDKYKRMRDAGHKNLSEGASMTCGCLVMIIVLPIIYFLLNS